MTRRAKLLGALLAALVAFLPSAWAQPGPMAFLSVWLGAAGSSTGYARFYNSVNSNTVTLRPGTTSASWNFTLPTNDGDAGQFLQTDGSGAASWQTVTTQTTLLNSTAHTDTTTGTVARGDVITGQGASATWTRLAIGAANRVLGTTDGVDITWLQVVSAMLNITTTSCTNQVVTAISSGGVGTCTSITSAYVSGTTGSGNFVLASSPTLTTPNIGTATGTSVTLSSLTAGRVAVVGTSGLIEDDADLNWSTANNRLGIGRTASSAKLEFSNGSGTDPLAEWYDNATKVGRIDDGGGMRLSDNGTFYTTAVQHSINSVDSGSNYAFGIRNTTANFGAIMAAEGASGALGRWGTVGGSGYEAIPAFSTFITGSNGIWFEATSTGPVIGATGGRARFWIEDSYTTLVDGSATAVFTVAVASNSTAGGFFTYAVEATASTNWQERSGSVGWSVVNEGGTETCVFSTAADGDNTPTGTLTVTFDCDTSGTNTAIVRITADSSLTTPTVGVAWTLIRNRGTGAITAN